MSVTSYHCVVVEHYDGSTVEAYKMFQGDSYRLQLTCKIGFWSWKFGAEKDGAIYTCRQSALIGCVGYLFRRTLHLSLVMQDRAIDRRSEQKSTRMPPENMIPTKFSSVDSIELAHTSEDFIDILKSSDKFYAFYSNGSFSGPYASKDDALKDMVVRFVEHSDELMRTIDRIRAVIDMLHIGDR